MSKQEALQAETAKFSQQVQNGLVAAYNAMLAFKKYKQSPVIVSRDGKIVAVAPEDMPILPTS
ncbi:sulfur carrier protein ThiS [Hymenobacter sp. UYAg731]